MSSDFLVCYRCGGEFLELDDDNLCEECAREHLAEIEAEANAMEGEG